jgi:hypothetical protein
LQDVTDVETKNVWPQLLTPALATNCF